MNLQKKATTYLATLTLFAIALYLFGQSLSMGRTRAAFILVVFSCALVLVGIGSSTVAASKSLTSEKGSVLPECRDDDTAAGDPAEESARHYANGRRLMDTYSDDSQKLGEAVREFHCAVSARPTFAFANYYLSSATSLQGTPQLSEGGFMSITSKDSLRNISDHEQKALAVLSQQHFAISPRIQGDFGFDTLVLGLAQRDSQALDRGLRATTTAVSLDDSDPVLRFNLAAALLANGQMPQALASYEKARDLVTAGKADLIGGAITDLNIVQQYCRGVRPESYCHDLDSKVPTLKADLAAAAWPPVPAPITRQSQTSI